MAFVFGEVISASFEWAYHEKDKDGIKIAAYAHFALDNYYDGFGGDEFRKRRKASKLFTEYNYHK